MFSNFIGVEAVGSSDAGPNIKPPNTLAVIGQFAHGTAANVDAVVAAKGGGPRLVAEQPASTA